jgi:4-amino-4-deoxy-L-arabinose transferase-like glycosyltransferase
MQKMKSLAPLLGALLAAVVLRLALIYTDSVPFNGDEAIGALMARHILRDGARPVFFYGQAYMGSLFAYAAALGFLIFGESVDGLRLGQIPVYLGVIVSGWWLARLWFEERRVADIAAWLLAVPTVLVSTYTVAKFAAYAEALVLGQLVLGLGTLALFNPAGGRGRTWLALGLAAGLGWWTLGISGVYLLPVALLGLRQFQRRNLPFYGLAAVGFFAGSWPWWAHNFRHDWEALRALAGPGSILASTPLERLVSFGAFGLSAVMGLRPPWAQGLYPLPLAAAGLWLFLMAAAYGWRFRGWAAAGLKPEAGRLLAWFSGLFALVFVLSSFGIDATGRYLLPLALPAALLLAAFAAGLWKTRPPMGMGVLALALGLSLATTWVSARAPEGLTTQFDPITEFNNDYDDELIHFLEGNDLTTGYSNHWMTFRIAFVSGERIRYSAELPYKADLSYTPLDNRYPPYAEAADRSERVAWVTTRHPVLDGRLRNWFQFNGLTFKEKQIGPYHIFYDFPRPVRPEEFDYGDGVIR